LACERQLALAYFYRLSPGSYFAYSPVFIADDNRAALTFAVAMDDPRTAAETFGLEASHAAEDEATGRRRYITQVVLRRLHQRSFRERVLDAYRRMCAFCRLRHEELLDAAHIIGDTDPLGEPRVTNGLALCKLHHAAFDRHFIGLRPDYCLDVRPDLRKETDGPTLVHAIQGLHGKQIHLPRHDVEYPLPALVRLRFAAYERASVEAMSTTTP
jgi:putative restriction endonuclease